MTGHFLDDLERATRLGLYLVYLGVLFLVVSFAPWLIALALGWLTWA